MVRGERNYYARTRHYTASRATLWLASPALLGETYDTLNKTDITVSEDRRGVVLTMQDDRGRELTVVMDGPRIALRRCVPRPKGFGSATPCVEESR